MVDDTYPQMPIIETKNYLLRPARLNDAEDMFEYYKQSKVVEYLPMSSHKTVSDTRRFIKSFFIDNYKQGKIGLNNVYKSDTEGEIGICINPIYWGHDIATELGKEVIKFAFTSTNIKRIVANTYENNKRTRKSLKHLNLKYYKTYNKKIVKGMKITYVKCDSYRILKSEYIKINRK